MTDYRKTLDRALSASSILTALNDGNTVDVKRADVAINRIAAAGAKLDNLIHGTAVACIHLSMPHVDGGHNCANRAIKLLNAMPKGSRAKALAAWFAAYSNIRLRYDSATKVWSGGVLKPSAKGYADARPAEAMEKPFWSVEEKATDPADFTTDKFAAAVRSLLARAKGDNAKLDDAGKAALADLAAIAAKLPEKGGAAKVDANGEVIF